jgi:hypothetical protein
MAILTTSSAASPSKAALAAEKLAAEKLAAEKLPAEKSFDSLEQEAYLQLWRTYDRLRELDERVFQRHGISAQQYNALRILKAVRPGALSTSAVGARLVSRAADMTRLLDKLEEQGFVARKRCEENPIL